MMGSRSDHRRRNKIIRRERRKQAALRSPKFEPQSSQPVLGRGRCKFSITDRSRVIAPGGLGVMHELVERVGLADQLNEDLGILKRQLPYFDSDHILTLAYNVLAGGTNLADVELLRSNRTFLSALNAQRLPGASTLGDFLRRFSESDVISLMDILNDARQRVWKQQPDEFFDEATIDVDSTIVPIEGHCKEGIAASYTAVIGYHPLLVSLAQTSEPLYIVNRPGNANSPKGATEWLDAAINLCKSAGFRRLTLRGDSAFSQTKELDRWTADGVRCLFGLQIQPETLQKAEELPKQAWRRLERPEKHEIQTDRRGRPHNYRRALIHERGFPNTRLHAEWVSEILHRPNAATNKYRIIFLRKDVEKFEGQLSLYEDDKYFAFITNDFVTAAEDLVIEASQRCNQEKLIEQLKNGVHAFRCPVNTLVSNWAYSVIASLALSLKTWFALLLPEGGPWASRRKSEKKDALRIEFKRFTNWFIQIPAQIVRTSRTVEFRFVGWRPTIPILFRVLDGFALPLRC